MRQKKFITLYFYFLQQKKKQYEMRCRKGEKTLLYRNMLDFLMLFFASLSFLFQTFLEGMLYGVLIFSARKAFFFS
jgi:hypothetical protein